MITPKIAAIIAPITTATIILTISDSTPLNLSEVEAITPAKAPTLIKPA